MSFFERPFLPFLRTYFKNLSLFFFFPFLLNLVIPHLIFNNSKISRQKFKKFLYNSRFPPNKFHLKKKKNMLLRIIIELNIASWQRKPLSRNDKVESPYVIKSHVNPTWQPS